MHATPDALAPERRPAREWTTLAFGVALGLAAYAATALWMHSPTPLERKRFVELAFAFASLACGAWFFAARGARLAALPLALLVGVLTWMSSATLIHLSFYLRVPVDLVGFFETQYLTDIVRWRTHQPLYGEPLDNNSYVYTPLAQIATYTIAKLFGRADSIPSLRTIHFGYVFVAAGFATAAVDQLVRQFGACASYAWRPVWLGATFLALLLVATDPTYNQNVHHLHPDACALALSMVGMWLLARDLRAPSLANVLAMACLPAIGFWAKQSLLIWGAIFGAALLFGGRARRRDFAVFGALSIALLAASLVALNQVGGPYTKFWVIDVLAGKHVEAYRSLGNLSGAGVYLALALVGGYALAWRSRNTVAIVGWLACVGLLCVEGYTSGFAYQRNHMGPGVLIAAVWFFAALVCAWSAIERETSIAERCMRRVAICLAPALVLAGLGLAREPKDPVPPGLGRYVAAIENAIRGVAPERLLLDRGSWTTFALNFVMKDRSNTVALHVGDNQAINRKLLEGTLARIRAHTYDVILVWFLDEGSAYDYRSRGSGIKQALLDHYRVKERIPGLDVSPWWPPNMLAEVSVLVPREDVVPVH